MLTVIWKPSGPISRPGSSRLPFCSVIPKDSLYPTSGRDENCELIVSFLKDQHKPGPTQGHFIFTPSVGKERQTPSPLQTNIG
ncbi:unnamed protein product, partial [Larinioides sclopetarius]